MSILYIIYIYLFYMVFFDKFQINKNQVTRANKT